MKHLKSLYLLILLFTFASAPVMADNMPKKGTPEYEACKKATIAAIDSVLHHSGEFQKNISTNFTDLVMEFCDKQCEKFKNDPDLMMDIADLFLTAYGSEIFSEQRYSEIKRLYPKDSEPYMSEGNLYFQFAWNEAPSYKPEYLQKAKILVDSAKIIDPNNAELYLRWAMWQAPYRAIHTSDYEKLSVDHELEQMKQKFPNEPCYRTIANYYNYDLSKKEGISEIDRKNFIVYATEFYSKEDRNLLRDNDIVDYADLCNQTNDTTSMETGLETLDYGIQRNPDYIYFYRYKLWITTNLAGRYKKSGNKERSGLMWNEALSTGQYLFEHTDSNKIHINDYLSMATVSKEFKDYEKAISYNEQLLANVADTTVRLAAMLDIIQCHNQLSQYEKTIKMFDEFESLFTSTGKKLEFFHYQYLANANVYLSQDTTMATADRIKCLIAADSIYQLSTEASPEYKIRINQLRIMRLINRYQIEYGIFGGEQAALPEFLEANERLVQSVLEKQPNIEDADYYSLMYAYNWIRVHYISAENMAEAFNIAEKITSVDMPSEFELNKLSDGQKKQYGGWVSDAQETYNDLAKTYGKKKKKK